MSPNEIIEIRLIGENVFPEKVKAGDIAEILDSVEDMVYAVVSQTESNINKEDILLGLVGIQKGSVCLQFHSEIPQLVFPAFYKITNAFSTNGLKDLPNNARKALATIASFLKRRNCSAEFSLKSAQFLELNVLAQIDSTLQIPEAKFVEGETVIYGRVIRVGGEKTPKVFIEMIDGENLSCHTSKTLAKVLGTRLYDFVGLEGNAKWNSETFNLEDFSIKKITPYEKKSIVEVFEELSSKFGHYFKDIDDADKYVNDLRNEEAGV